MATTTRFPMAGGMGGVDDLRDWQAHGDALDAEASGYPQPTLAPGLTDEALAWERRPANLVPPRAIHPGLGEVLPLTQAIASGRWGDDADNNGVPDVLERKMMITERFAPRRGVRGDPKQAFRMDDPNLSNDQLAMGIAAVDNSRRMQDQREADAAATDANIRTAGRQTGIFLGSRPSRFHLADLASDSGRIGAANDMLAAAGRGDRANVRRFNLMQEAGATRAADQARLETTLGSQERQARITGRYNLMGEQARAAGQVASEAVRGILTPRPPGPDPIRNTSDGRLIDTRTGREIAPEQKPTATPGLRESPVQGVYFYTNEKGETDVKDLRERISSGDYNPMRYYEMQRTDPKRADDYLWGRGEFARGAQGAPGAGSPAVDRSNPQPISQDQQALEWARNNPYDPRAALILQRLGR